jgi:hypothetical protein
MNLITATCFPNFHTLLLFALLSNGSPILAQALRQPIPTKAVPILVMATFNDQYKGALVQSWYATHLTYWVNDISSSWYSDWYGPRQATVYVYEKPNYYEVQFTLEPGELSRAIYNRYGYWYETRTQIKGLPKTIQDSLQTSKYKDWKVSPLKETIKSDHWPELVYRFKVSKGLRSVVLRMNERGELVQRKIIKE